MSDQTVPAPEPEQDQGPIGSGGTTPYEGAPEEPAPPPRPSVIDAAIDLLQTIVDWLRQEADDILQTKIVTPLQRLGLTIASASAAGCLAVLGLSFISVALLLLLAGWLGWPGALALIGGVLLVGSVLFTVVKMRNYQKPVCPEKDSAAPSGPVVRKASGTSRRTRP